MNDPRISRYRAAAQQMQGGNFSVDIPVGSSDQVGELGQALQNLAQMLDGRFHELEMLATVTEEINAGLVLDEVLGRVFDSFRPIIPYNRIGFALLEQNDTIVRARWAKSDAPELRISKGFSAPLKGSSLQTILDTGQPRILNDLEAYLREHPQSVSTPLIVQEGMRSSLTCPLIAMGKPIGFMFFSSMGPDTYRNAHVAIFKQIAGQLSVIVEKSKLYQQLLEMNDLKNRFLGIAAHDLRNPLAAIKGFADLISGGRLGPVNEKQRMALAHVDRGSEIMLTLINDLLDVSAIESGKLTLRPERIDLNSYLTSCHETNSLLAQGKNIALRLELAAGLPAVTIDQDRMNQVFGNLIGNAIKYSYPATTTRLCATKAGNEVQIAVIDQGQGIPAADMPKLFKDFGKANVLPTAGEKSTGLGLAICRRIVEAHKGRIWCESEVGKGSSFMVAIPCA
jgi:hypothetical protein